MAEIKITIPNDKVQLVLDAFAAARGIPATPTAVKQEFIDEIKAVVKRYKVGELEGGRVATVSQDDMKVDLS